MTDKTDIAALMRDMRDLADRIVQCQGENSDGEEITRLYDQSDTTFKAENILLVLSAFEAERQRADDAERAGDNARSSRDLHHKVSAGLNERLIKAEAEISALKGDQVPVGYLHTLHMEAGKSTTELSKAKANPFGVRGEHYDSSYTVTTEPLYDRPQKPVISKEKLCDWLEDNFDIDDSQRDAFAQCFAHHCNCIVKDGD